MDAQLSQYAAMYHSLEGGLRGVENVGDSAKGRYRSTISQSLGLRDPTV